MLDRFLKLLGYDPTALTRVGSISRVALEWQGWPLWIAAIVGLLLIVWTWRSYQREGSIRPVKRSVLAVLRITLLVVLCVLLTQPVLRFDLLGQTRRVFTILIDTSGSMNLTDGISAAATQPASRIDRVRTALSSSMVRDLQRDNDVEVLTFNRTASPVAITSDKWLDAVAVSDGSSRTALGDAIAKAISDNQGRPTSGMLLITDGANNAGVDALAAAREAGRAGVPIYAWGVGDDHPRDVAIAAMTAPSYAFKDDEAAATITVHATGLGDTKKVRVLLKLGTADGGFSDVGWVDVPFDSDGTHTTTIPFTPKKDGIQTLRAQLVPMPGDVATANDFREQPLPVSSRKLRVLMVDRQPRWDFKYLQAALVRDKRVDLKCLLLEGDPEIADAENSPYVKVFPTTLKELAQYDVVILGDVDASDVTPPQQAMLKDFVSTFGGGIAVVAGKLRGPWSFAGTPLASVLPVELTSPGVPLGGADSIEFERTINGAEDGVLKLEDDPKEDTQTWLGLPALEWAVAPSRAKPAAQVLLQTTASPTRASVPLIALQQYGLGQSLFVGTDNLWRWRRNVGDRYYARLWAQFVQRLGLTHSLGQNQRTQLSSNRVGYEPGEAVTINARLFDADLKPLLRDHIDAQVRDAKGKTQTLSLWPIPDQPGAYRAQWTADEPSKYELSVTGTDEPGKLTIDVMPSQKEFADIAMNSTLLREIADQTGGAMLSVNDLAGLPSRASARLTPAKSSVDVAIWSSPLVFVVLLCVVALEWTLRRFWHLK